MGSFDALVDGYAWGLGPLDCSPDLSARLRSWLRTADGSLRLPSDVSVPLAWSIGTGSLVPASQRLLNLTLGRGRLLSGAGPARLYGVWNSYTKVPIPPPDRVPPVLFPFELVGPGANVRTWQSRLSLLAEFFAILSTVPILTENARLLTSVCRLRAMDRAAAEADVAAETGSDRLRIWLTDHPQLAVTMPLQFGPGSARVALLLSTVDAAAERLRVAGLLGSGEPPSRWLTDGIPEVRAAMGRAGDAGSGSEQVVAGLDALAEVPDLNDPALLPVVTGYINDVRLTVGSALLVAADQGKPIHGRAAGTTAADEAPAALVGRGRPTPPPSAGLVAERSTARPQARQRHMSPLPPTLPGHPQQPC